MVILFTGSPMNGYTRAYPEENQAEPQKIALPTAQAQALYFSERDWLGEVLKEGYYVYPSGLSADSRLFPEPFFVSILEAKKKTSLGFEVLAKAIEERLPEELAEETIYVHVW